MDAREAIATAKRWIADIHADEDLRHVGLEEVRKTDDAWRITIGFSRPWDDPWVGPGASVRDRVLGRTYKVVTIDDRTGDVLSSEIREPAH
ncbi:hypothetical protein [Methylobacterium aquaticum]|uniref:hypothetical protein n=1 Tax=Methylobacterium aquaticum TaxID=270351 RepID=UPI001933E4D5|nr:hypothetical protein [Methylobacterium aquaticum]QRE73852.1 hypothetical protein F1D61_09685 [Methylobacterium aquaticum]